MFLETSLYFSFLGLKLPDFGEESILFGGGGRRNTRTSVELWSRHSRGWTKCEMAPLPGNKPYGTLNGLKFCGGSNCAEYKEGAWVITNNLAIRRYGHTSWETENGIYLMGGSESTFGIDWSGERCFTLFNTGSFRTHHMSTPPLI